HAGQDEANHVEVAFDEDDGLLAADRLLRLVEVVEHRALVIDRALRGIEVLGLAGAEQPPAESHRAAAEIADREEQPPPEARPRAANHSCATAVAVKSGSRGSGPSRPPRSGTVIPTRRATSRTAEG